MATDEEIPVQGKWPVEPQEDQPIDEGRIWVDGCFDFSHHGHAGAMLQARQLGTELYVGIHSDEEILANKGPTVMTLLERVVAVDACRWSTKSIPHAPYVTSLPWISHYGCQYVVHGDDVTSDSSGQDCYRFVKAAGRFLVVKRTPGISTTNLVGRMLLCTKEHFIKSFSKALEGEEGPGSEAERKETGQAMLQRMKDYATDETGKNPECEVFICSGSSSTKLELDADEAGQFTKLVTGQGPRPGQRIVYVDGGFDLFSPGQIQFLKMVVEAEVKRGHETGWYDADAIKKRVAESGKDYSPAYLVAGVHDDRVINHWKGLNYPIMNIFERGLCVLQCRYINSVVFGAPFTPSTAFLESLPFSNKVSAVYHGPTTFMALPFDPYASARSMGIFHEIGEHQFENLNAGAIVRRILDGRAEFEARQKRKGEKGIVEEDFRRREQMEMEAHEKEKLALKKA